VASEHFAVVAAGWRRTPALVRPEGGGRLIGSPAATASASNVPQRRTVAARRRAATYGASDHRHGPVFNFTEDESTGGAAVRDNSVTSSNRLL
jgi:hypothetical protein